MSTAAPYLTPQQVYQLNEKHGWFQYNDAQSDVSNAFAQDAIAMHERVRAAAPALLAALVELMEHADESLDQRPEFRRAISSAYTAIFQATGSAA